MKRKKSKSKPYSGYMKFPIMGADNHAEFLRTCEFYGSFAIPRVRNQIFSKPRKYRMEIWIKLAGGEYEVSELSLPDTGVVPSKLAEILHDYAVRDIKDLAGSEEVDFGNSYFKVIV